MPWLIPDVNTYKTSSLTALVDDVELLQENFASVSAPTGDALVAGMIWFDSSANAWKGRNSSNTSWVTLGSVSGSFLSLSGGTMTGNIDMDSNNISNIGTINSVSNITVAGILTLPSGSGTHVINQCTVEVDQANLNIGDGTNTAYLNIKNNALLQVQSGGELDIASGGSLDCNGSADFSSGLTISGGNLSVSSGTGTFSGDVTVGTGSTMKTDTIANTTGATPLIISGSLSGIQMNANGANVTLGATTNLQVESISSNADTKITFGDDIDMNSAKTVINLPAPTNSDDAARRATAWAQWSSFGPFVKSDFTIPAWNYLIVGNEAATNKVYDIVMPADGRLMAITAQVEGTVSAGSFRLEAKINNTTTLGDPKIPTINATGAWYDIYATGYAFSAGDRFRIVITNNGSFSGTVTTVAQLWCNFDE